MKQRLDPYHVDPASIRAVMGMETYVRESGLEHSLLDLVKTRASQVNGCANCLHMHTHEARQHGESEERLYLLNAWREAPVYSERERAALAWTETLTLVAQEHAPDGVYAQVRAQFTDAELVKLTMAIATINVWNRMSIGFNIIPQVAATKAAS